MYKTLPMARMMWIETIHRIFGHVASISRIEIRQESLGSNPIWRTRIETIPIDGVFIQAVHCGVTLWDSVLGAVTQITRDLETKAMITQVRQPDGGWKDVTP